jgi:hypothetical protein
MLVSPNPLVARFATAGLEVVLARPRFVQGADDAFHLSIERSRRHRTRFSVWPGAAPNRLEVLDVDRELRQLLLFVDEPSRWVTAFLPREAAPPAPGRDLRIVAEDRFGWTVARRPPGGKRRFLIGRDERDLFVAQIPAACSTVRAARAALRPLAVERAARRTRVLRQGEWFFLEPSPAERSRLELALTSRAAFIVRAANIRDELEGRRVVGGNPHVADELVALPSERPHPERIAFVRGRVRHPDHATVRLRSWRRVVRNAEVTTGGVAWMAGVAWVD